MGKVMRAIGLASATSLDGFALALIETDGEAHVRSLGGTTLAYDAGTRARLAQALDAARTLEAHGERPGDLAATERRLTELHAEAVLRFMGDAALQPFAVDVIGLQGLTVLTRPAERLMVAFGDGGLLAARTGIDVVHDFGAADMAAGGHGAPLAPVYHRARTGRLSGRPIAVLTIAGTSSITYIARDGALTAFDAGPGNTLLDAWMWRRTGAAVDADGALAAAGVADEKALGYLLSHPFFARLPPKQLDPDMFPLEALGHLSAADGAATLVAFTARAVARARAFVPEEPRLWVVTGSGRRNHALMRAIAAAVENAVVPAEAVHIDGDVLEAEAWAYLAVRALQGLPITFPATTGAPAPMSGGIIARAPR